MRIAATGIALVAGLLVWASTTKVRHVPPLKRVAAFYEIGGPGVFCVVGSGVKTIYVAGRGFGVATTGDTIPVCAVLEAK